VKSSRELRKQLDMLQLAASKRTAESLLESAIEVIGVKLVVLSAPNEPGYLIEVGNALEELENNIVAVMLSAPRGRLIVKAGKGAMEKGVHAGILTTKIAKRVGGRGGGQPYLGQAGGVDVEIFEGTQNAIEEDLRIQLG
jgi:alanyl-tRNA synthetase